MKLQGYPQSMRYTLVTKDRAVFPYAPLYQGLDVSASDPPAALHSCLSGTSLTRVCLQAKLRLPGPPLLSDLRPTGQLNYNSFVVVVLFCVETRSHYIDL